MMDVIISPSSSTHRSTDETIKKIKNNDKKELVGKWKTMISSEEANKIQEIFNMLNISEYSVNSISPDHNLFKSPKTKRLMSDLMAGLTD